MREIVDPTGEKGILRQIDLVRRISQASDDLSSYLPGGEMQYLINPKFSTPPRISSGRPDDTSRVLNEMAQRTKVLCDRSYSLPGKNFGDFQQDPCRVWEINPPQDIQDIKLPGFGLKIVCPQLTESVTAVDLDRYRRSGSIDVDRLWFEDGKVSSTKPINVFLEMIKQHPIDSLEIGLWILEGLRTSDVIHAEEESLKL